MSAVSAALGQGVITTVAGTDWIYRGETGPALNAPLGQMRGVALDAAGNLFAADAGNHLVVKMSPSGVLTAAAGNGVAGFSGDGGPATSASLSGPAAVALDAAGNLYIADSSNNRIRRVSPSGTITTVAGSGVSGPSGLAVDSGGNLYISDSNNNRIRKVSAAGVITTVAGKGAAGFSGDGGPATAASLNWPQRLALDAAGNLYIADFNNYRVRKVDAGNGIITTVAGNGVNGGAGDGGPATAAQLSFPSAVAVDSGGSLYIGELVGARIRRVNPQGIISTVAGGAGIGFSGDGGPATKAKYTFS
jgi:sugar lactone lactonase YvrE